MRTNVRRFSVGVFVAVAIASVVLAALNISEPVARAIFIDPSPSQIFGVMAMFIFAFAWGANEILLAINEHLKKKDS